jgi:hypothetical protein
VLRLHVNGEQIAVADDRMDKALVHAAFAQDLRLLRAVLVGILLKIQIVQDTDGLPEVRLIGIAKLGGKIPHHIAHDTRVQAVEFTLIIFAQQVPCLLSGRNHSSAS